MNAPPSALLSLDQALAQLLASALPLGRTEWVSTFDADGRVLAQDVVSELQVPSFDNSAMDGYAVRSSDIAQASTVLRLTQRIAAGSDVSQVKALDSLSAARIFTGAPIPKGATSVVMQEDCEVESDQVSVRINKVPAMGDYIRRAGEDIDQGSTVLCAGTRLAPPELGLAASVGVASLKVTAKPRVALFSTGDELVMPGDVPPAQMREGKIYNSNRFFLRACLTRMGCEVTDFGIVPDTRLATVQTLSRAAPEHDLILTIGGVSVGEEDHIKPAVQQLGELSLWQIAIKPGKPFAFGKIKLGSDPNSFTNSYAHFIGLPGNPVSSFVTFLLLVRPFLLRLQGTASVALQAVSLRADFDWLKADKRREFLRVRKNSSGGLDLFRNQSSSVLTSLVWADGLVDNAAGQSIRRGDLVNYLSIVEFLQ